MVTRLTGALTAPWIPGVKSVQLDVEEGGVVREMTSSLARIGHAMAEGGDAAEAIRNAEAAGDPLRVVSTAASRLLPSASPGPECGRQEMAIPGGPLADSECETR